MAPDPDTRGYNGLIGIPRNRFQSKWDILFDKDAKEWIAFKPALGLHVYPCYSCRHMFYSKKSFLDHINRRAVLLQYTCSGCHNGPLTFYNRCAFLLHCRSHYNLEKGQINLNHLEVNSLPLDLAGFSRHPEIPYIFDVAEDLVEGELYMNAQFYKPKIEDKGKPIISLHPSHLVINRTNPNGEIQELALRQIAKNIPKCQFVTLQVLRELRNRANSANLDAESPVEVKNEPEVSPIDQITFSEEPVTPPAPTERQQRRSPLQNIPIIALSQPPPTAQVIISERPSIVAVDVEDLVLPVITKIETVEEPLAQTTPISIRNITEASSPTPLPSTFFNKCTECTAQFPEPLSSHILGGNRPVSERYRCPTCKLICPTMCSLKAHARVHDQLAPYVCPDCGDEFPEMALLISHMDEVCFHMAKSVRYRCPGRRCGKIFASDATFGPHFKQVHINTLYMCATCKEVFTLLEECEEHCLTHVEESGNIVKLFSCSTCGINDMNWHQLKNHLDEHCKDLSRCIYIYMCKFCKCYFRSVQTMSTHLLNCKVQKSGVPRRVRSTTGHFVQSKYISGPCKLCNNKMICLRSKPSDYCSKCVTSTSPIKSPNIGNKAPGPASDKCVCILCKVQIDFNERRRHQLECKYGKPHIMVEKLDLQKLMEETNRLNQSFSSSSYSSEFDGSHEESPHKRGESGDENRPRKRHRPSRPKKPEVENDMTAEEPITFDGTYQCRLCDFKNTERQCFHDHIKSHRHISTAYQCMECGECFVVKPTLVKHLLHFHNISNSEQYFLENDCFDQSAVTELAKVVKAPYLANSVKENQCKVCMEQFDDSDAHNKHFRMHGMAFLMKNSI